MTLSEFHGRVRLLHNLDFHELVEAGVIDDDDLGEADWRSFRENPCAFLIRVDDVTAERVWALCERRAFGRKVA